MAHHHSEHGHSEARLGDGTLIGEDFQEGLGHELPLNTLRNVLLVLLFLTVVTVAASRVDFGSANMIIAVIIATIKAAIVATFFMHLKFEGATILMYVFYPIVLLFLFVGSNLADYATREHIRPAAVPELLPTYKVVGGASHEGHGEARHTETAPAPGTRARTVDAH